MMKYGQHGTKAQPVPSFITQEAKHATVPWFRTKGLFWPMRFGE